MTAALLAASCGSAEPQAKYAPGFERSAHRVSVLGVFRDGRMDEAAWKEFEAPVGNLLGAGPCAAAFGDHLRRDAPALFSALDEQARQDGVTPDLLDGFASHTAADLVLVIYLYGQPASTDRHPSGNAQALSPNAPTATVGGRRSGRRGRGSGQPPPEAASEDAPGFEVGLSLFAPNRHEFVAEVELKSPGATVNEAAQRVAQKLGELIPGSSCAAWSWK
jgi:hypothetical protein